MNICKYADSLISRSTADRESESISLVERISRDLMTIARENNVRLNVKVTVKNSRLSLCQRFLQGVWVMLGFDKDLYFDLENCSVSMRYGRD